MDKFKVGDMVALKSSSNMLLGRIEGKTFGGYYVEIGKGYHTVISGSVIVPYEEIPDMSDDEIYDILEPKMDKSGVYIDCGDYYEIDYKKAIALAYRSGYLRAKKGRPFKIGGNKQ